MWNSSHGKLTGDWQKDSCTNEVVREIHMGSGRKERKMIRLGPAPLERDSEENKDYTGRDPPQAVSR